LAEPGDLLYLPPGWGHDGVALDHCFTYSVGFRAPRGEELAAAFLDWLHARGLPEREYRDPGLPPAAHSARIPQAMLRHAGATLARMRWSRADVADFLGEYLSAPKPHVSFEPRRRRLARAAFARRLERADAVLDRKTQLLYLGRRFFLNGDALAPRPAARVPLARLADARRVAGRALARGGLAELAREWYHDGVLHLERAA
jgi:50S ribosomal protein L16 3-hydroxylase